MSVQATTWVWEEADVTGSPLLVLLAIADAANREGEASCQSIATLVQMTRLSESTVHRAIRWLTEEGLIRSLGISPRYGTHVYCLPQMGGCQIDTGGVSSAPQGGVTGDTQPQSTYPRTTSRSTASSPREPEGFSEWWALYPKKTGKQAALREYAKALKTEDPSCLLAGLQAQVAALQEKCQPDPVTGKIYCPDPRRWLYEGRWSDEITPMLTPLGRDDPFDPKRESRDQYLVRAGYV